MTLLNKAFKAGIKQVRKVGTSPACNNPDCMKEIHAPEGVIQHYCSKACRKSARGG